MLCFATEATQDHVPLTTSLSVHAHFHPRTTLYFRHSIPQGLLLLCASLIMWLVETNLVYMGWFVISEADCEYVASLPEYPSSFAQ